MMNLRIPYKGKLLTINILNISVEEVFEIRKTLTKWTEFKD